MTPRVGVLVVESEIQPKRSKLRTSKLELSQKAVSKHAKKWENINFLVEFYFQLLQMKMRPEYGSFIILKSFVLESLIGIS